MPIGEVIEKAFKYPWKNRALWFYGILLAIFSAGSSVTNQYEYKEGDFSFLNSVSTSTVIAVGAILAILAIVISIAALIISSWSQVALMKGARELEEGREITRKEIGKTGKRPVWKLIVLNAFIPLLIVVIGMLIIGALVALFYFMPQPAGLWIGITVGIIAFIALIPFIIYWAYVWILAGRFVALEDMNAFASLGAGRRLIKGKFWWTFLLGLVQGMISGFAGFVALLPLIFLGGTAAFFIGIQVYAAAAILGVLAIVYLVAYVVAIGYFVSFEQTGWTIWWLKLKELNKESKSIPPETKKAPVGAKKTAKKK